MGDFKSIFYLFDSERYRLEFIKNYKIQNANEDHIRKIITSFSSDHYIIEALETFGPGCIRSFDKAFTIYTNRSDHYKMKMIEGGMFQNISLDLEKQKYLMSNMNDHHKGKVALYLMNHMNNTTVSTVTEAVQRYLNSFSNKESNEERLIDRNIDIPDEFLDPITLSIMNISVILDGKAYDYYSILQLPENNEGKRINPITRDTFSLIELQADRNTQQKIEDFIKRKIE